MEKFKKLGRIVETAGVSMKRKDNRYFSIFVMLSLARYRNYDWGDLCQEDIEYNNYAASHGERIHAAYIFDPIDVENYIEATTSLVLNPTQEYAQWKPMAQDEKHGECKIWIITEWDRSTTTILFPDEY